MIKKLPIKHYSVVEAIASIIPMLNEIADILNKIENRTSYEQKNNNTK